MRWLVAFGRFWYDFIVGDSVALAVGGAGVLALAAVVSAAGGASVAQVLVPLAVIATVAWSVRPAR